MFRDATLKDVSLLWRWRNEAEREGMNGGWYQGSFTTPGEHRKWFLRVQGRTMILLWDEGEGPLGTVRVESNGEVSFFVPVVFRSSGVTLRMLRAILERADGFGGRLKAVVDEGNSEMWMALRAVGFREYPARFLAYKP